MRGVGDQQQQKFAWREGRDDGAGVEFFGILFISFFSQVDLIQPRKLHRHLTRRHDRSLPPSSAFSCSRRIAVLHRASVGSLERFLALLLELHGGYLPLCLAPQKVSSFGHRLSVFFLLRWALFHLHQPFHLLQHDSILGSFNCRNRHATSVRTASPTGLLRAAAPLVFSLGTRAFRSVYKTFRPPSCSRLYAYIWTYVCQCLHVCMYR